MPRDKTLFRCVGGSGRENVNFFRLFGVTGESDLSRPVLLTVRNCWCFPAGLNVGKMIFLRARCDNGCGFVVWQFRDWSDNFVVWQDGKPFLASFLFFSTIMAVGTGHLFCSVYGIGLRREISICSTETLHRAYIQTRNLNLFCRSAS